MRQLFKIDESEKKRILEMHENATKKNYLNEQGVPETAASSGTKLNGKTYKMEKIIDDTSLRQFLNWGINSAELAKGPHTINVGMVNTATGRNYTVAPERTAEPGPGDPYFLVDIITKDLDLIAQNYTIDELCKGVDKKLPLKSIKSLEIAKTRVQSRLGWCRKA
jgi:hypothetical protein